MCGWYWPFIGVACSAGLFYFFVIMVIRNVLVFIKVFRYFSHFFYVCKWKDGRFLPLYYAAITSTSGMYLCQILKVILLDFLYEVKKIALCEYRVRQSVRDLVLAAKP